MKRVSVYRRVSVIFAVVDCLVKAKLTPQIMHIANVYRPLPRPKFDVMLKLNILNDLHT